MTPDWLHIQRGQAPLIVSMPHTGIDLPADVEEQVRDPWLARKDADWHVDKLYAFAAELGATLVRTTLSRTVIDVNRDPSGVSLYPGRITTGLCPTETFDGEPLYVAGLTGDEIERRRGLHFDPYHQALQAEIDRLRAMHPAVVLYEAHSIRSHMPRLFEGELPLFNIGTNDGRTCAPALEQRVVHATQASGQSWVLNGRFKGGWTTRHYGHPAHGVHAIQMELAMRGYLDEPANVSPETWPVPYDPARAASLQATLRAILQTCIAFAEDQR
jgi:N-formylglutamate deformylase